MDIVEAIREVLYLYGTDIMGEPTRYNAMMADLAPGCVRERHRIYSAFYCGAMNEIRSAVHDAGAAEPYFIEAEHRLRIDADMNDEAARQTIGYYKRAFGFPGCRETNPKLLGTFTEDSGDRCKFVYEGEMKDGKPHGIGTRTCYYDGKFAEKDESVWLYGSMNGYCKNSDLFMGSTMVYTEYFVVADRIYGIETSIDEDGLGDRIEYDNQKGFISWQSELN